jgi:predicted RNase H-like nuclease (RuvC/YqgF family)
MNPAEPKMEMGMDNGYGAGEGEEELDLEAILRELEAQDEKDKEQKHQMASKMANLQKELAEYRKVVEVLRGKLNEVNLLNAKLLYTNKIFRKEGLTNEQKVSILESFDRAINVREVKMVYTTLAETMTVTAKSGKSRTSSSKVVTEGLASKPTPSTAPKKEILEENTVAKRLQQLAGIL